MIQFVSDGVVNTPSIHGYLLHMQRHIVRREEGRGNKCTRCCLWFNQRSSLKNHQIELHDYVSGPSEYFYNSFKKKLLILFKFITEIEFKTNFYSTCFFNEVNFEEVPVNLFRFQFIHFFLVYNKFWSQSESFIQSGKKL